MNPTAGDPERWPAARAALLPQWIAQAPAMQVVHVELWNADEFRGSRAALVALGLASDGDFPGDEGRGSSMVTFARDGRSKHRGDSRPDAALRIHRRGARYAIQVYAPEEEVDRRRHAARGPVLAPAQPREVREKSFPPPVQTANGAPAPMPPHEAAVIAAALAILGARLRQPCGVFDTPGRVRDFLTLQLAGRDTEGFGVMYLDAQHSLIAFEVPFEGTLTCTYVYPRELVRRALHHNAAAVILAHNHPSGSPEPSRADELMTSAVKAALSLVDVRIVDHLVIGGRESVSFAERGML